MFLQRPQAALVARLHEFMHESGGRSKGHSVVFLAGGQPHFQGDVGFAGAGGAERDDVMPRLDPFAARQFQHLWFVEGGQTGEVKAVEALGLWKARRPDAALDVAPLAVDAFQINNPATRVAAILASTRGEAYSSLPCRRYA